MPYDNHLTRQFRETGAVICGKSATPEYGLMVTTEPTEFGPTRNPWDTNRTTGGSSGGAASAVSSRIVPIAHASDGGGSIRIPAASCGLVGLKPNRARTSFAPSTVINGEVLPTPVLFLEQSEIRLICMIVCSETLWVILMEFHTKRFSC